MILKLGIDLFVRRAFFLVEPVEFLKASAAYDHACTEGNAFLKLETCILSSWSLKKKCMHASHMLYASFLK